MKGIVRLGAEVARDVHMRVDRQHAGVDRLGRGGQFTFGPGGGGQRQAQGGKRGAPGGRKAR